MQATCTDGQKNGAETDVDCGGSCPKCLNGRQCSVNADCWSNTCSGSTCTAPATCGNNACDATETPATCPGECPITPSVTMISPAGNAQVGATPEFRWAAYAPQPQYGTIVAYDIWVSNKQTPGVQLYRQQDISPTATAFTMPTSLAAGQYTWWLRAKFSSGAATEWPIASGKDFTVTTTQAACGNNIIEGTEQCDGTNLGTATCVSVTGNAGASGRLSCTTQCQFSTAECTTPTAAALTCQIAAQCSGTTTNAIVGMTAATNAHANVPGQGYNAANVCCSVAGASSGTMVLRLASSTNSHVALPSQSATTYPVGVYLPSNVQCNSASACTNQQTCLFSLWADSNAHIGPCSQYTIKQCCSEV